MILLICSLIFLINIVRVLMTKLHPKSTNPAPLAIKKAVRATLILVRRKLQFLDDNFDDSFIFFKDSSVWSAAYFVSLATWQKFVFGISLPTSLSHINQSARILRIFHLLLRKPRSFHCCLMLSKHAVSKSIQNVLSWKLLRARSNNDAWYHRLS